MARSKRYRLIRRTLSWAVKDTFNNESPKTGYTFEVRSYDVALREMERLEALHIENCL